MAKYLQKRERIEALREVQSKVERLLIKRAEMDLRIAKVCDKNIKENLKEKRKVLSKKISRAQASRQYLVRWDYLREYQSKYRKEKKNANKS